MLPYCRWLRTMALYSKEDDKYNNKPPSRKVVCRISTTCLFLKKGQERQTIHKVNILDFKI
uniref:Ovule protein n=1 Tax=Strongyloides papillosus TaxID=174720 RepID=A0A0N5BTM5_STREA